MNKDISLNEMDALSKREIRALSFQNITTLNELISINTAELRRVRLVGEKSYQRIVNIIHTLGLYFKDERWKNRALGKEALNISISEIGLSKEAVYFLKEKNRIENIFDFLQIRDGFLSLHSLLGYRKLGTYVKIEIKKKRKELSSLENLIDIEKIQRELGSIYHLVKPLESVLPENICAIIKATSKVCTMRELVQMPNDYDAFKRFRNLKKGIYVNSEMYKQIVSICHQKGYYFVDERLRKRYKNEYSKEDIMHFSIRKIGLCEKDIKNLEMENIKTVGELCSLSLERLFPGKDSLYSIRGIGVKTTVIDKIHELGILFKGEIKTDSSIERLKEIQIQKETLREEQQKIRETYKSENEINLENNGNAKKYRK